MRFEKIEPGMVLFDVRNYRMGNTTLRSLGTWSVRVLSVDRERRNAQVSWNSNPPQTYSAGALEKLKSKKPTLIRTPSGAYRRPTREEAKALKQAKESQPC